jgi:hypothetical protein
MSDQTKPKLLTIICIFAAALTATCRASAQTAPPVGCNAIQKPASAGGASTVQETGESLQHKSWQPTGGEIQFTVKSFESIPANASVFACFRWKTKTESKGDFIETHPSRLDLSGDGKLLKVTTTVPDPGRQPNDVATASIVLPLVPLAEVRILAIDNQNSVKADVTSQIGITYAWAAFAFAVITMLLAFVMLCITAAKRLQDYPGIQKASYALQIISTPSGFASLSQLQIVLWTFVVAGSAVYVMSLSGELIQITSGTLVLLGIAGAAGIGAKVHTQAQGATVEAAAAKAAADKAAADIIASQKSAAAAAAPGDPVAAAEQDVAATDKTAKDKIAYATKSRADALKNPPKTQTPRWSDLIVNESIKDDGTTTREIDVARVQMLLFTLITAIFVFISVLTNYVIPEISSGFQTLMGISNGVYLGSKIAQGS